jgi:hypothetical protein
MNHGRGCVLEATTFFCEFISFLSRISQPAFEVKARDCHVAQDIVSCLYHIQDFYGSWLAAPENPAGNAAIVDIGEAMLATLHVSTSLSDCLNCNSDDAMPCHACVSVHQADFTLRWQQLFAPFATG